MNLQKTILTVFSCFLLAYGQTNLFENPSFENGETWWNLESQGQTDASIDYTAAAARTGERGAEISVTQVDDENWHVQLNTPTEWEAVDGVKYHLSFYAKADGGQPIHVAVQDGPANDFEYRKGFDFTLKDEWSLIEVYHTSDVEGVGEMRLNVYVGGATGTYYFDDFVLREVVETNPGEITLPEQGAYETGVYRNLFEELGKTPEDIDAKVEAAFQSLFHGSEENEAVYFEVGNDMAFTKAIDTDDIRSEGLSYAMMIAVQLDKKEEFDKIWKFSKTHVQHQEGPRKGYFAWQVSPYEPYTKMDDNTAPDGEEYFVMALFFAAHRWGDGEGIFDYSAEANQLLHDMLHLEERNGGVVDGLVNMFNADEKKVVFVPKGDDATYTDPSYYLPAFYKLWAEWADEDKEFWAEVADTGKVFLMRAMHQTTGLTTDYMSFDAEPQTTNFNELSHRFAYDSWRVGMNVGFDCHWFGNEGWQAEKINTLLNFFHDQGAGSYKSLYEREGTPLADDNYHSTGLVACNGAAALGATDSVAWEFVSEFWETPVPTGVHRYYDGMLYMMSLLHAAGKFRIWHPDGTSIQPAVASASVNVAKHTVSMHKRSLRISFNNDRIQAASVQMYTPMGQRVLQTRVTADAKNALIDCSRFAKGMYYVSVTSADHKSVQKVVLK